MIEEFDEYPIKKGPPTWLWPSILVVLSVAIGFLLSNLLRAPAPEQTPEPMPERCRWVRESRVQFLF